MPLFEPFAGLRYTTGPDLAAIAAPPYDVIDDDQRVDLEERDPHNSVRLILPVDGDRTGDRYERAASTMTHWLAAGVLERDGAARFYGYRMDFTDSHGSERHTVGVIGALHLPDEVGSGDILPHERTLPKAKSDRLDLLRATRANLDPIWGVSLTEGFAQLVDQTNLLAECVDELGVHHRLFAIDDPERIDAIRRAVAASPMVLADGHHRFETACNYRAERATNDLGATAIMAFVVELSDDELCIEAIHRLVTLPDGADVRGPLADAFEIGAVDDLDAALAHSMVLVDADGLWALTPIADVVDAAIAHEPPPVRATDAAVVEHVVVPRWTDAQWVYRHDAADIVRLVRSGAYSAGLVLRPATVATTRGAAELGVRMPQKTTFFFPKPRTGMVFRTLD